ncbi:Nucleic-acid-binding protein from transposon X-element, partial [Stegodyphus mimosarum]
MLPWPPYSPDLSAIEHVWVVIGLYLKLFLQTELEFREVTCWMKKADIQYKTLDLQQDRPIKIVIRGLPAETEIEVIKNEVESMGFKVHRCVRLTAPHSKHPMPLVYLQVLPHLFIDHLYTVHDMWGTEVSIEHYRGRKGPTQCFRCRGFFHSLEVCTLQIHCVRCSGPHWASECTRPNDIPATCCNCGGDHPANFRSCPRFPGNKRSRGNKTTPKNRATASAVPSRGRETTSANDVPHMLAPAMLTH